MRTAVVHSAQPCRCAKTTEDSGYGTRQKQTKSKKRKDLKTRNNGLKGSSICESLAGWAGRETVRDSRCCFEPIRPARYKYLTGNGRNLRRETRLEATPLRKACRLLWRNMNVRKSAQTEMREKSAAYPGCDFSFLSLTSAVRPLSRLRCNAEVSESKTCIRSF